MVAFSRKGCKDRREEVEKLPCPSVFAEGSFRVFSGKMAKGNPSWSGGAQKGGEKPYRAGVLKAQVRHFEWPAGRQAGKTFCRVEPVVGPTFVSGEWVSATVEAETERQLRASPRAGGFLVYYLHVHTIDEV